LFKYQFFQVFNTLDEQEGEGEVENNNTSTETPPGTSRKGQNRAKESKSADSVTRKVRLSEPQKYCSIIHSLLAIFLACLCVGDLINALLLCSQSTIKTVGWFEPLSSGPKKVGWKNCP
jgi:hypothetical protein